MPPDGDHTFAEWQEARDAATFLLGVGGLLLIICLGVLVYSVRDGFGIIALFIGWPYVATFLGGTMVGIGAGYAEKAKRIRPE